MSTIHAVPVADSPCWELRHPGGDFFEYSDGYEDGGVHCPDEEAALREAARLSDEPLEVVQLDQPCVRAACTCGELVDESYHHWPGWLSQADLDALHCSRCT